MHASERQSFVQTRAQSGGRGNADLARNLNCDHASVSAHNPGWVATRCHRGSSRSTTAPITMLEPMRTSAKKVTRIRDDKTSQRGHTELIRFTLVVGGKPAAAAYRDVWSRLAGQGGEGQLQQTGLEIHQRDIDCRDGAGHQTGTPQIPTRRAIRSFKPGTSIGLAPRQTALNCSLTTVALPAPEYAHPNPDQPPARASTSTIVVDDHASVPSASASSVGISYTPTFTAPTSGCPYLLIAPPVGQSRRFSLDAGEKRSWRFCSVSASRCSSGASSAAISHIGRGERAEHPSRWMTIWSRP